MDKYLFSYNHDGSNWSIEIYADSPEDARARLKKLPFATYDGQIVARLPATLTFPGRILVALRNFVRGQTAV